ncbi:MAG TPA: hypothetical protein ENF41_00680 [Candidatus Bathyarchaeota archaeon]|nr:hypothetical protein [Candidatus Bathyarchaeota archaeon]
MRISGRRTGMGAYTDVRPAKTENYELVREEHSEYHDLWEFKDQSGCRLCIRYDNFSRSGNHWDIHVSGNGVIDIIDISNSGKHRCRRVKVAMGQLREVLLEPKSDYWDICPICYGGEGHEEGNDIQK